ncbi:hypothetical protein FE784_00850 [Paenibacillus hemerocallicola]|uniref:Uncharacterized protein n=1 Tax=Paenibacillus hemerocallicola TaxID=1172614 RepID=A0A5C4TGP1_9BACL|nr:hypothetical protein [Paenibacillus hemerocallicola]TNJ68241.1 hypothetical protein FE784_00850 [Paenibacillus hemerocallicola]
MKRDEFLDKIGWFIEKVLIILVCVTYSIVFLYNRIASVISAKLSISQIDYFLLQKYDQLITPNIGTITTIASVFVGIYVTVLSVLGSIKANSLVALLTGNDLSKLIKYIRTALISSFLIIFYSLFVAVLPSKFTQAFFFFLLLFYMLLTAFRFGINILVVYSHDLQKLMHNLEDEKQEKERMTHVMYQLEKYLHEKEVEGLRERSTKAASKVDMHTKSEE